MNAVLRERRTCIDCVRTFDISLFPFRDRGLGGFRRTTCLECTRERANAACRRSRERAAQRKLLGVVPKVERPYWTPPTDFLCMGEPDRGVALRWSL